MNYDELVKKLANGTAGSAGFKNVYYPEQTSLSTLKTEDTNGLTPISTPSNPPAASHRPNPTTHFARDPLPQLSPGDFPRVKNWYANGYNNQRKGGRREDDGEDDEEGPKGSILSSYMIGEDGNLVSKSTMHAVREEARSFYLLLLRDGKAPHVWGEAPIDVRNELLYRLETSFPFLRYCDNHWKAKKVATNGYSQWKKHRAKKADAIDVDADDEGTLKRPRETEGDVAGPSKRTRIATSGKQRTKVRNISILLWMLFR